MKAICIFLTLVFSITVVQADLVMEFNWGSPMLKIVTKVKGDKIWWDGYINGNRGASLLVDLKTGDYFNVQDWQKKIIKNPSILQDDTNAIAKAEWPKFQDTGKTEMLDGYEAEIYKCTNFYGASETLWVANDYPDFGKIKNDLSKLDKFNDKKWMLEFSSLHGMPLKLFIPDKGDKASGRGLTFTLISAKEEFIDDTNFDLPKDYHFYSPTNAPTANTNAVISTTNEPLVR